MQPIEDIMTTEEHQDLLEKFCRGEVNRRDLQNKLREYDNGALLQRILACGLQPPRLKRRELEDQVDPLVAVLSPWATPSRNERPSILAVVITDSWVLADWAQRGVLREQLNTPGVLWFITDVVHHWAHRPATEQRYPGLADRLHRNEVQTIQTQHGALAIRQMREEGALEAAMDSIQELMSWANISSATEPGMGRKASRADLRLSMQFDKVEARIARIGRLFRWVLLNADDFEMPHMHYSAVSWEKLSVWEAATDDLRTHWSTAP